jgi:hypothetical protein
MKILILLIKFLLFINIFQNINTNIKDIISNANTNNILLIKESRYRDLDFLKIKRMLMSKCNPENCYPFQGNCKGEKCFCLDGYKTLPTPNENRSCNYVQKKVIFALLLESFGLFGFGHIYCERYFEGVLKIIWFFINIFFGVQFVMAFMKEAVDTDAAHYIKVVISLVCLSVPVIWHFIDLYNFSNGNYKDGNEIELLFY